MDDNFKRMIAKNNVFVYTSYSKMRVNLASQVLSETVLFFDDIWLKEASGTAKFCLMNDGQVL